MKTSAVLFEEGYNCSQSVFAPFALKLIPNEKTLFQLMSPFGGGIAHTDGMCGAVTGAIAAIGLHLGHFSPEDTASKNKCSEATQRFISEFSNKHGNTSCTKLTGFNLSSKDELEQAKDSGVFKTKCLELVKSAEEITLNILTEINQQQASSKQ